MGTPGLGRTVGLGIILSVLGIACGPADIESAPRNQPYQTIENTFTFNGLIANGLMTNGLRMNGLRMNGLRMNGLRMNGLSFNDLSQPDSMTVMTYIASCALPAGDSISFTVAGETQTYWGALGFAPELNSAGGLQDAAQQEKLTACLMARTNAVGLHILISLTDTQGASARDPSEASTFNLFEAYYLGNVMADSPWMSSCAGDHTPSDAAGLTSKGRTCSMSTICGFTPLPMCPDLSNAIWVWDSSST
jgi:hypothetical protein